LTYNGLCGKLNKETELGGVGMEAYCVKCKAKKEMKDPQEVTLKNGRKAVKGKCPDCGTVMFRIKRP